MLTHGDGRGDGRGDGGVSVLLQRFMHVVVSVGIDSGPQKDQILMAMSNNTHLVQESLHIYRGG